ncbi:TPA: conjugal transfer protein TraD [Legionella pneumophila]|nr:conjugal transfer protein TraD [Legionella pneumophila subsp. fraseri]HAT1676568.1 conjugal transfer protein TraD [Legionella pneumophila]HAT8997695.1 conjugal transfer protein TraD [Legionella pneumophila subsp. pneumophila]MDW9039262.1 conjugal transfer protein TraD [Legionella pneumophila subsp. fraseri]MDW9042110.1 conjugal transfer protein TraD [Legionella pneumophila subsp. fraseri]
MTIHKQIEKEKQLIARCENSLALDKLKKRKADTRRKIELGGLVIKSKMNMYSTPIILGALCYTAQLIGKNNSYKCLFDELGSQLLIKKK